MSFKYKNSNVQNIIEALQRANNPKIANIKYNLLASEQKIFRQQFENKKILVAGSGLGQDSLKLARFNEHVTGIEKFKELVEYAQKFQRQLGVANVSFLQQDFMSTSFTDLSFDISVLNMGTICNFSMNDQKKIFTEMMRISKTFYFSFYLAGHYHTEQRLQMYQQEWDHILTVKEFCISNDLGFGSTGI